MGSEPDCCIRDTPLHLTSPLRHTETARKETKIAMSSKEKDMTMKGGKCARSARES